MSRNRNSFITPLVVEVMPSGKRFKVARQFTFVWQRQVGEMLTTIHVHVPVGFETDFASVPRICRLLIPKLGKYTKASVVHDWLYEGKRLSRKHNIFTRAEADRCFYAGMTELGVVPWKRWVMWAAVRVGGWMAWHGITWTGRKDASTNR